MPPRKYLPLNNSSQSRKYSSCLCADEYEKQMTHFLLIADIKIYILIQRYLLLYTSFNLGCKVNFMPRIDGLLIDDDPVIFVIGRVIFHYIIFPDFRFAPSYSLWIATIQSILSFVFLVRDVIGKTDMTSTRFSRIDTCYFSYGYFLVLGNKIILSCFVPDDPDGNQEK